MGHLWFAWCLYWLLPVVIGDDDDDDDDDDDVDILNGNRNMAVACKQNTEPTSLKLHWCKQTKNLDSKLFTFLLLFQRSYHHITFTIINLDIYGALWLVEKIVLKIRKSCMEI